MMMKFRQYRWHGVTPELEYDGTRDCLLRLIAIAFDDGLPLGFELDEVEVTPYPGGGRSPYPSSEP
jgi:hypothetical protein